MFLAAGFLSAEKLMSVKRNGIYSLVIISRKRSSPTICSREPLIQSQERSTGDFFPNRSVGAKDPPSAAADFFRGSLNISGNYSNSRDDISQSVTVNRIFKNRVRRTAYSLMCSVASRNTIPAVNKAHAVYIPVPEKHGFTAPNDTLLKFRDCLKTVIFLAVVHEFTSLGMIGICNFPFPGN